MYVSPIPVAGIQSDTYDLCAQEPRTFVPTMPEIPGALYTWDFGIGAVPAMATGYGPHTVVYTTTGEKTVSLIIDPNDPILANCPDTAAVSFDVIECPGNIAGLVKTNEDIPLQGVPIQLWSDTDTDGQPDPGGLLETSFSSSQGQFAFTQLLPGNYVLKQVPFPGYFAVWDGDNTFDDDSVANLDILDELIPVTVDPGADDNGNTFIKSNDVGSISGSVYEDLDMDEALDAGEGLSGVWIRLFADADTDGLPDTTIVLDSVQTDAVGNFVFLWVEPGHYALVQEQQAGFASVDDYDASPDGDIAPNVSPVDNTLPVSLALMETDGGNTYLEGPGCMNLVTTTADSGMGSLRHVIACVTAGDTIVFAPALAGDTIYITSAILLIDKDISILCDLAMPVVVKSEVAGLIAVSSGSTVMIGGLHLVSGPAGDPAAIDNQGDLILDDVLVRPHPELNLGNAPLVRNAGMLTILGTTQFLEE